MRKIMFGLLFGIFILVSLVNGYSTEPFQWFKTKIVLKETSSINMSVLENLCSENYCYTEDTDYANQIIFKITFEQRNMIFIAEQDKKMIFIL